MYQHRTLLQCPVCYDQLGYLTKNELCSFVCQECQFIFSWDKHGKILPPVKVNDKKPKTCTCESCKAREYK